MNKKLKETKKQKKVVLSNCPSCFCSNKTVCSKCSLDSGVYCRGCCGNKCEINCGCRISKGDNCRRFCRGLEVTK